MKNNYVSIYVRNADEGPSCYYRIVQYTRNQDMPYIEHNALNIRDYRMNMNMPYGRRKKVLQAYLFIKIVIKRLVGILYDLRHKPSFVIVQREMFPRRFPMVLNKLVEKLFDITNVIWDYDDDIFNNGELTFPEKKLLFEKSKYIIATSDYLLSFVKDNCSAKLLQMPTTDGFSKRVIIDECICKRQKTYINNFELVWVGTHTNLNNIDLIIDSLDKAAEILTEHNKKITLNIVCNIEYRKPQRCKYIVINNYRWTRECAEEVLLKSHLGIMPLVNNRNSLGKGGFKLIQYMSVSLPVLASNVGFNKEIVSDSFGRLIDDNGSQDWTNWVVCLAQNVEEWKCWSKKSYEKYMEKFDYNLNLESWQKILNDK